MTRQAFLWDMDGTLIHLRISLEEIRTWKARMMASLEPFGWTTPLSPMLPTLERALAHTQTKLSQVQARELRIKMYEALDTWEQSALQSIELVHHGAKAMCKLSAQGHPTAILTNNGPGVARIGLQWLTQQAQQHGWPAPKWQHLVCRGPHLHAKPAPDMLQEALEALHCTEGVMIGDSRSDKEAAAAMQAQGKNIGAVEVFATHLAWVPDQPDTLRQALAPTLQHLGL